MLSEKELLTKDILELESIKANMLVENKNMTSGYEKLVGLIKETEEKSVKVNLDLKTIENNTELAKKDNKLWNDRVKEAKEKAEHKSKEVELLKTRLSDSKKDKEKTEKDLKQAKEDLEKEKKGSFAIKQEYKKIDDIKKEINEYYREIKLDPPYAN